MIVFFLLSTIKDNLLTKQQQNRYICPNNKQPPHPSSPLDLNLLNALLIIVITLLIPFVQHKSIKAPKKDTKMGEGFFFVENI